MLSDIFKQIENPDLRNILVVDCADDEVVDWITLFQTRFPQGVLFSDNPLLLANDHLQTLKATQAYLGMTTEAVFLDLRTGFPLDYFLSIASTVASGGILLIVIQGDLFASSLFTGSLLAQSSLIKESERFHQEAIDTPFFHNFLQSQLAQYCYRYRDGELSLPEHFSKQHSTELHGLLLKHGIEDGYDNGDGYDHEHDHENKHEIPNNRSNQEPDTAIRLNQGQREIFESFLKHDSGIFTLFSARGTGKSWLGSQLIAQAPENYILTAPNQNAINQYQHIAALQFKAPDALFLTIPYGEILNQTLVIEEAAKMPLIHLERLCARFRKVLMISSVENYEGTGQGLREKINDLVTIKARYKLTEIHRFNRQDPLKKLCDSLMFAVDTEKVPIVGEEIKKSTQAIEYAFYDDANVDDLRADTARLSALYHLLNKTHYQTNIQDIRRLFDAPGQVFVLAYQGESLVGAIWGIEEGGLSSELAEAVFKGLRRPKGNLVAQMLTSQSYFPEAMLTCSVRISRISVEKAYRREGIGGDMVRFLERNVAKTCGFISVSFGLTQDLFKFWQSLGYEMAHLGFHFDKTTGLYSAVVLKSLSASCDWILVALRKFRADAYLNIESKSYKPEIYNILKAQAQAGSFDERDCAVIEAYEGFKRGKHTVVNAYLRKKQQS